MAGQFAHRHFLRMAPNAALEPYFKGRGLLEQVSFEGRSETDIDEIYDAWQALPSSQRAAVDVDFSEIDSLSTEEAMATLVAEAGYLQVELGDEFSREGGFHDKAFSVFLHHRDLFDRALQLVGADDHPTRYWYKRNDLPDLRVPTDDDTVATLGSTLRYYFKQAEGRGHVCVVEPCQREDSTYFFCYLEDFARADQVFGAGDRLEKTHRRPAFGVIFVVSPSRHSLDVYYEGTRKTVKTLETIFSRVVFGFDLPERRETTVFELNALKDRAFPFLYDPPSGITGVVVKQLIFSAIGGIKRQTMSRADTSRSRYAVYDFMDEIFDTTGAASAASEKLPLAAFNIIQARLQVSLQPIPRRRTPTRTFSISFPNGCSLGHDGQDAVIRDMLRLSGIEQRPTPGNQRELVGSTSAG